jgi:asparagine synthase (glutamine-hydrolysing)
LSNQGASIKGMCGISGFLTRDRAVSADALSHIVLAMTQKLIHRGPDDCGEWVDQEAGVALGHRRLSIIDLSPLGHQPMVSADGRFILSYNGEVYNYRGLRGELEEWGYPFAGKSDTEVLLAGFLRWGIMGTLRRSNGMFALALWDRQERTLTLARDRAGEKPLYYGCCGNSIVFASELKSIRAHPDFTGEIDRHALWLFLNYGWVPSPYCIYHNLRKLPPGCFVTLTAEADPLAVEPISYWSAREAVEKGAREPFPGTFEDAVDEVEGLLKDAVGKRMMSDVPLGALLSGGIDSSCVVSLMQSQSSHPVKTFSIGVHDRALDEARYAKEVAAYLGTDHHELYVDRQDVVKFIPKLPEIYDEPLADISQIPTCLISELARRHVTVALSGDGGDEGFAGYTIYDEALDSWSKVRRVPLRGRRLLVAATRAAQRLAWAALDSAPLRKVKPPRRWHRKVSRLTPWASILSADSAADMLRRYRMHDPFAEAMGSRPAERGALLGKHAEPARVNSELAAMLHMDFVGFMTDDILVKVDRASMAMGLEVRCPFLDHRLVELAWSLPVWYCKNASGGKRVLKEMLGRHMPRALFERPKQGFSVPSEWFEVPLREWANDLVNRDALRDQDHFDAEAVEHLCRQQRAGWEKLDNFVFHLTIFQGWRAAQDADGSRKLTPATTPSARVSV